MILLKLSGIIFIIISGAGLGIFASHKLRVHSEYCAKVRTFLCELDVLIRFSGDTLQALFDELSQRESLSGLAFPTDASRRMNAGESFPCAWKSAVLSDKNADEPLKRLLLSFGESLGTSDVCGQQKNILRAEEELLGIQKSADNEYSRKGRLYRSLGLLGGITAALLLC